MTSTLLNAAYFAPVVYQGFFGKASEADVKHNFARRTQRMVIPLSITAVISVLIGLYPVFHALSSQHSDFMKLVELIEFLRNRLKTGRADVLCAYWRLLIVVDALLGR